MAGVPGTAPRPTPPPTPPVFATADGKTAIHLRDGREPMYEVWQGETLVESVRATRAWRAEKNDLIARYNGTPPSSGADKLNSDIRAAAATQRATTPSERDELQRMLHEEMQFNDPTGDAAAHTRRAATMAEVWNAYGAQYGGEIFQRELARARRAASGRERAKATLPTLREEIDLTTLIVENRRAENHAANPDALRAQAREDVRKVSAHGLGKYNEWLQRESSIWFQREQEQYGADIERETPVYHFGDD